MARCNWQVRKCGDLRAIPTRLSGFCERPLKLGVNHIDTSDFYGPHVTNQIIKQALHPYPDGLVIVTKWVPAGEPTSPGFTPFRARN